jgi:hypothetical protein
MANYLKIISKNMIKVSITSMNLKLKTVYFFLG